MTEDELDAAIATFDTYAAAREAANAAMPRRKHNRPYPNGSGYHSARAGHDVWIVWTGNVVLLRDGSMYDYQRRVTIRP
jgi:hypothetical protein